MEHAASSGPPDRAPELADAPEHRNDRRRFIVWAVLCGYVQPERLTEAVLTEVEREARA